MTISDEEEREIREIADAIQDVFENHLNDSEKIYNVFPALHNEVLLNSLNDEGYPKTANRHNVRHDMIFEPILPYEDLAELYIISDSLSGLPGITIKTDLDSMYDFIRRNLTWINIRLTLHTDIYTWIERHPTVEYFAYTLKHNYSDEVLSKIVNVHVPDYIHKEAVDIAREEGFNEPEKVSYKVEQVKLSMPLETYAERYLNRISEVGRPTSWYVQEHIYDDIIDGKMFTYSIQLTDDAEDNESL